MCNLCDETTRDAESARLYKVAEDLRRLADRHVGLAAGRIAPHSYEAGEVAGLAHKVIRELVEEWL